MSSNAFMSSSAVISGHFARGAGSASHHCSILVVCASAMLCTFVALRLNLEKGRRQDLKI